MSQQPPRRGRSSYKQFLNSHKKEGIDLSRIRWSSVALAVIVILGLVGGVVFGISYFATLASAEKPVIGATPNADFLATVDSDKKTVTESTPGPTDGIQGSTLNNPLDLSAGNLHVVSKEANVNTPDIFGNEMVYSAGTGSLLKPLLKTLYLFNLETGEEKEVVKVKLKDGEIYETVLNNDYIAWLETDQNGSNRIYVLDRNEEGAKPRMIKECSFAVPKLRLSQDYLIWIEQNEEKEERLYVVDLISEENASIPGFVESIERAMSVYGVSAPCIYDSEVVWAASDPNQSQEDSIRNGEKSAIYSADIVMFAQDDYAPAAFSPNMYVHDPVTNGEVWAWIDKNKAPDSSLYIKVGHEVKQVAQGVITYTLGDEMLVFGKDGNIYAYFYKTGEYGRINEEGKRSILPVVSGRRVVFFEKSADSGKDQLVMTNIPFKE